MGCSNTSSCACTYASCPRHGKCCECVAHHQKRREIPGCLFTKEGEAAYDRSFAFFQKDRCGRP